MAEFQIRHPYHSQGLAAGGSALLDAINRGKVHLAKFILDAGEYDIVNTRDFNGKTPLIRACYIKEEKTRDKAVALLLRRGADVNLRDDVGRTACAYACQLRCNDVVRILVKNNVNPDIADNDGNTPLIISATVGNDVAIEILIRSFRRLGLNVNHVNNDGLTALLVAAKNGFIACASLLAVDGRANTSRRDPETGMTAEQLARDRGCSLADVMPFSAAGNPGGGRGGSFTGGRGAFWAVKAAWSSRRFSGRSGTVDTGVGGRDEGEDELTKGCSGKKGVVDGGVAMEQRGRGEIGREGEYRMHGSRGFQRSFSLPSLRIGFEGLRASPSAAAVQPCSTSLSGSRFLVKTSATMSSHSSTATDETSEPRRSPAGLTEQSAMKNGATDKTPGNAIPAGLDSNMAEGSGRGEGGSGESSDGREAFQSEVKSGSGGKEMVGVIRGRQPYEDLRSVSSLTPSTDGKSVQTINDHIG